MGWLVTTDNDQFMANSLDDLKQKARSGELSPGDLVQPPGARDWLYAYELPEMGNVFSAPPAEISEPSKPGPMRKVIALALVLASAGGFYQAYEYWGQIPTSEDLKLLGENGLANDEGLITSHKANVYQGAKGDSKGGTLKKDTVVKLKEKRNQRFKVKAATGTGWVSIHDIAPAYLFADKKTREHYNTRFNTHRKVHVRNHYWDRAEFGAEMTTFHFQLHNTSEFDVSNVEVKAQLKSDGGESVLREENFVIEGIISAGDTLIVGTLRPRENSGDKPRYMTRSHISNLEKSDPTIKERWVEVIEVPMTTKFAEAIMTVTTATVVETEEQ